MLIVDNIDISIIKISKPGDFLGSLGFWFIGMSLIMSSAILLFAYVISLSPAS